MYDDVLNHLNQIYVSFKLKTVMPLTTNAIGDIGEMTVSIRLMEFGSIDVFLLGGKVPAFDLLAELIPKNAQEKPYQFLIQVKTTNTKHPFTKRVRNLKTPVPDKKLKALINRPLPTYVAGVDLNTLDVYLVPAFDRTKSFRNSIPTRFKLEGKPKIAANERNLNLLRDDVKRYWQSLNIDMYKPNYNSAL